MKLLLPEK